MHSNNWLSCIGKKNGSVGKLCNYALCNTRQATSSKVFSLTQWYQDPAPEPLASHWNLQWLCLRLSCLLGWDARLLFLVWEAVKEWTAAAQGKNSSTLALMTVQTWSRNTLALCHTALLVYSCSGAVGSHGTSSYDRHCPPAVLRSVKAATWFWAFVPDIQKTVKVAGEQWRELNNGHHCWLILMMTTRRTHRQTLPLANMLSMFQLPNAMANSQAQHMDELL